MRSLLEEKPAPAHEEPLPRSAPRTASATRNYEQFWLLGLVIVTACSWGRFFATGSPKVDENYPSEFAGRLLLLALIVGYGLMVASWAKLLADPPARPAKLAFLGLAVASLMLPMITNDVFSLSAYGSVAGQGHDVYTTSEWLATSPFYPWVGGMWSGTACVYGPVTLAASMPTVFAHGNPWLALLLLRVTWLTPTILVMVVSFRQFKDRPFFHAMVWLNPLWLVEGPGQLHSDLIGFVAVIAAILLQERGKSGRAWVAYSLAAFSKYSFLPVGLWFWLNGTRTWRERAARLPLLALVMASVGVASYSVFWQGMKTLTEPARALASFNPGGSIIEIIGHVGHFLRGGGITPTDLPAQKFVEVERATKGDIWAVATPLLRAVAVVVALRVLYVLFRKPSGKLGEVSQKLDLVPLGTGVIVIAALTVASHRFQSWYLLAAIPFFGLECTRTWRRWWVLVVGASVSISFVQVLPRTSPFLPIWSTISNAADFVLFLTWVRARYWSFGDPGPKGSESVVVR